MCTKWQSGNNYSNVLFIFLIGNYYIGNDIVKIREIQPDLRHKVYYIDSISNLKEIMKDKKYKLKYTSKTKKKNRNINRKKDISWIINVTLMAFFITFILTIFSESTLSNVSLLVGIIIVLLIIILGIIFDMIGIAVTVADPKVFNSMATKKVRGAKTALKLMKSASKVSSFCNDVIGDICGILSGAAASTIAIVLANKTGGNLFWVTLLLTSLIASITIGGKACGKSIAINKSNSILYKFSKIGRAHV